MTVDTKPLPAILTRAIVLDQQQLQKTINEAALLLGLDPKDRWQLSEDATAFVKPDKKPDKPDG